MSDCRYCGEPNGDFYGHTCRPPIVTPNKEMTQPTNQVTAKTIDSPEFRELLWAYRRTFLGVGKQAYDAEVELLTHIDAKIAEAVREAVSEALTRFVDADMENRT